MSASSDKKPRVALIGAGAVGEALGKLLVKHGYSTSISNSRGPETLRQLEQQTGATAMDIKAALALADIVVLAVPMDSIPRLQSTFQASLRPETVVIDSGNYYPARDGRIKALDEGQTDTEWVSVTLGVQAIKVFNNIIASNIFSSSRSTATPQRVALTVSGDNKEATKLIMEFVENIGFNAYDAGALADSWRQQPGQPAYCTEPNLQQLPGLLARAERSKGPIARDKARAMFDKLPSDYPGDVLLRVSRLANGMDWWKPSSWLAAVKFSVVVMQPART